MAQAAVGWWASHSCGHGSTSVKFWYFAEVDAADLMLLRVARDQFFVAVTTVSRVQPRWGARRLDPPECAFAARVGVNAF
jgi:hypothetical protein